MLRVALLLSQSGITRQKVVSEAHARGMRLAKRTLIALLNDGRWPLNDDNRTRLKQLLLDIIRSRRESGAWMRRQGCSEDALWETVDASGRYLFAADHGARVRAGQAHHACVPAMILGNALHIQAREEEKTMINQRTLKHFKLFSNPFAGEIRQEKDIFLGEEHIFLREMMLETARNCGFTAVIGEVGSGKSIMRKAVASRLISEGVKIIFPLIVDKHRITPSSLIDAIIMDISEETPKRSLEAKTRQAFRLLKNRSSAGLKQVLMIEEAHLLTATAIKSLKQIHELESGYEKTAGIIILGQTELKHLLDETMHPELREVIRRITVAEITDLGRDLEAYLKHKFQRVAAGRYQEIFAADCLTALQGRLPGKCYPLSINALVAKAMNLAAEMGETLVTPELVNMA